MRCARWVPCRNAGLEAHLPQPDGHTFVKITESGFTGNGDSLVEQVTSSTQGFSLVLAGLKAYLEHGIELNLVADRFPKGVEKH